MVTSSGRKRPRPLTCNVAEDCFRQLLRKLALIPFNNWCLQLISLLPFQSTAAKIQCVPTQRARKRGRSLPAQKRTSRIGGFFVATAALLLLHLPHLLDAKLLGRSSLSNQNQNDPPSYRTYQNPVVICALIIDRRMLNHCLLKQPMLSRTISIRNRAGNF
jgi:hypothetical protein